MKPPTRAIFWRLNLVDILKTVEAAQLSGPTDTSYVTGLSFWREQRTAARASALARSAAPILRLRGLPMPACRHTEFGPDPRTLKFSQAGTPGQGGGEAALAAKLARRPARTCPARGKKRSPRKFFISRPIWTKFGRHVTWDPGRQTTDFETNPTTLNFSLAGSRDKGPVRAGRPGSSTPAACRLPHRPGEKYGVPETFSFLGRSAPNLARMSLGTTADCPQILSGIGRVLKFG